MHNAETPPEAPKTAPETSKATTPHQGMVRLQQAYGAKLKALRLERSLTQLDVARAVRTASAIVSNWERGERRPSDIMRKRLTTLFQLNPLTLFDLHWDIEEASTPARRARAKRRLLKEIEGQ